MSRVMLSPVLTILLLSASVQGIRVDASADELLFDHRQTDLTLDPGLVLEARESTRILFIRLSHGRQITVGLERIEDEDLSVCLGFDQLCEEPGALDIYNRETLPYDFWLEGGADSIRAVLAAEDRINMVMFAWCTHLNSYSLEEVDMYLDSMASLEVDYPGVIFVYATGTAEEQGGYGFNRYLCNLKIRNHCHITGRMLYDFADIESWYGGQRAMYEYNGVQVPYLHPDLYGNDAEHASFLNCEYKAMVFWHMVVSTVDDLGVEDGEPDGKTPPDPFSVSVYPNPFNPRTTISFTLRSGGAVRLGIYDAAGRLVRRLIEGDRPEGTSVEYWDGLDGSGGRVASGVYIYRLRSGKESLSGKLVLMR
ncbi:MAG TPA: T9SS type A sorting domain-containing protein [Candidatus Krumholzibacterium sp.]|nr:T9SS type A sorting domain-containing protein [Candidatus Krumholzibacterium sp.]